MIALLPKFNNVNLVCDDSLTIQPHKVILQAISTVSNRLLTKHQKPIPSTSTQLEDKKGKEEEPQENQIDYKVRTHRNFSLGLWQVRKTRTQIEVSALLVQPSVPPSELIYCSSLLAKPHGPSNSTTKHSALYDKDFIVWNHYKSNLKIHSHLLNITSITSSGCVKFSRLA